jgi:3-hydroxyisobutyrate dehydrogenase
LHIRYAKPYAKHLKTLGAKMETVAFIGLGNLGLPMAANLKRAGHRVLGFDIVASHVQKAVAWGAEEAPNAAWAAAKADVIVTMVPSGRELKQVLVVDGVAQAAKPGALIIDCSTVDLESAEHVKRIARSYGHEMVDAPVSGGAQRAVTAKLTIMVGGPAAAFARAEPILARMASTVVHMGDDGSGLTIKICNNMIAGATLAAVSEAYALAQRLGVDDQKFYDVVSKSSGQCWALTEMCPVPGPVPTSPANNEFKPGGAASMLMKDLGMAQQTAIRAGMAVPMAASAYCLYTQFCSSGHGDLDVSAIIKLFQTQPVKT